MPVINHFFRSFQSEKKVSGVGCTNPGQKYRIEYQREDDEYGVPHLVEIGKVDIQEENNSNEVESFSSMVNRYMLGDELALGTPRGVMYGDFSNFGDLETVNDNYMAAVAAANAAAVVSQSAPVEESEVKTNGES